LCVEAYIEELAELVSKFASGAGGIRLALAMMPLAGTTGGDPLKFIDHQHPPSSAFRRVLTMVLDRLNNALEQLDLALLGGSGDHKPA
jgi:hypothetical protein